MQLLSNGVDIFLVHIICSQAGVGREVGMCLNVCGRAWTRGVGEAGRSSRHWLYELRARDASCCRRVCCEVVGWPGAAHRFCGRMLTWWCVEPHLLAM